MLVSNLLLSKEELTVVSPKESAEKALDLIKKNNLLSIPVVDGDKFYGSISKEAIYETIFELDGEREKLLSKLVVEELMIKDLPMVNPTQQLEEAIVLLEKGHIPFIAVIDKYNKFHGIITHKIVFQQFTDILGINKGKRISIITHETKGQLSKLSKIITQNGGNIMSTVVIDPRSAFNLREIVIRIKPDNFGAIVKKIKEAGFNVET
ncbi:CBS domain-containing protein [Clostridium sp. ZS2-4]|uniref:CBS domain-containing protein n=1 Tax=Clostridium sp. ZS2-4 TaxID=2987703 RepID=UPI00227B361B|nr:CBS domain-containing protein [Clostridium sp. ZS2-4]MCY6355454.1 CBS domain-containing protein [Clostridium sp. ZS2-4]